MTTCLFHRQLFFYMPEQYVHFTCFLKVMCQIHCPVCVLIAKEINCHLKSFPEGKRTDLYLCQGHLCSMRKQLPYSTGEHLERQVLTCGYLSRFIQAEVYAETRDDWHSHVIIQRLNNLSSRVWKLVFTVFDKDGSIFLFKYNFSLPVPKSDIFFKCRWLSDALWAFFSFMSFICTGTDLRLHFSLLPFCSDNIWSNNNAEEKIKDKIQEGSF